MGEPAIIYKNEAIILCLLEIAAAKLFSDSADERKNKKEQM